jgi:hypothetical protein
MNYKQIEGTILLNDSKFVIVRVGETEYQISNWYGTKKLFGISNKDLPISCKGVIVKYTASFYGSRYKSKVFEIKQIIK